MKARFRDLGDTPFTSQPAEFGKLLASETEKWGKVIRSANTRRSDPRDPGEGAVPRSEPGKGAPHPDLLPVSGQKENHFLSLFST